MKRDVLRDATMALSQSGHDQAGGKFTRERVVATLHDNQRRGRARRALLLPMAAIFVGSTAFAGVNGSLSKAFQSVLVFTGFEASPPVAVETAPASPTVGRSAAGRGQHVVAKAPESNEAAEPEATAPDPTETSRASSNAVAASPAAGVGSAPVLADGHELYRRGHRAHFKEGNPARALEAYDAYLKQQPGGRFAVDARYNRALCLVRLGRHEEARKALAPFANGEFGDYRKEDAQRLLDALNQ